MRRNLDKAFAFAALTAVVWLALAVHLAAQSERAGPTVALVRPFGGAGRSAS